MTGPLDGVTVVSVEQAVAAPLCTARLAQAGARVIKVERPEGDFARAYDHAVHGESAFFVWLNRGKESIVLDIKQRQDAALLHRLISRADVFVQNLSPGAAARAGFGATELRARHPRLITCDISGYGDSGPYRDMRAYDLLVQCEAGLASITGSPDEPGRVGISVADIGCGTTAHGAILQALYARERTGAGAGIHVSLFDTLAEWMTVPLLHQDYAGRGPARIGLRHPLLAPYGLYHAGRDGRAVVFGVQNEREWRRFCALVLGRPELAEDPRFSSNAARVANRPALDAELASALSKLTGEHLLDRLKAANIAYGALNTVEDLTRHPQLRRSSAATPTGPVSLPAHPVRWADAAEIESAVAALDEHGAALRREFADAGGS